MFIWVQWYGNVIGNHRYHHSTSQGLCKNTGHVISLANNTYRHWTSQKKYHGGWCNKLVTSLGYNSATTFLLWLAIVLDIPSAIMLQCNPHSTIRLLQFISNSFSCSHQMHLTNSTDKPRHPKLKKSAISTSQLDAKCCSYLWLYTSSPKSHKKSQSIVFEMRTGNLNASIQSTTYNTI